MAGIDPGKNGGVAFIDVDTLNADCGTSFHSL